ncbi:putative formin-binding protein 1-like isoform X15, partial [Apostichopus japonicus]
NYSSLRTFKGVLQEVGSIANQHELISDYLGKDVLMEVVRLIAELKKERKEHLQEAKHEENVMDKSKKKLDSCKSAYRAAHEQWMQAKILFEKADSDDNRTKAEVERARSTMDNKNKMREDQKNDYILQLQNTNKDQEEHYYKKVPTIFNKLQTMEERRITCLGKYYETYAECHKKVLPVITQCLDDIQTKHGQSVKPAERTLRFKCVSNDDTFFSIIEPVGLASGRSQVQTGIRPPPDIVMVDLDEPGSSRATPHQTRVATTSALAVKTVVQIHYQEGETTQTETNRYIWNHIYQEDVHPPNENLLFFLGLFLSSSDDRVFRSVAGTANFVVQ